MVFIHSGFEQHLWVKGQGDKMFLDNKNQRRIPDLSTLCRVVQKTHKVKLNFVRKCKF